MCIIKWRNTRAANSIPGVNLSFLRPHFFLLHLGNTHFHGYSPPTYKYLIRGLIYRRKMVLYYEAEHYNHATLPYPRHIGIAPLIWHRWMCGNSIMLNGMEQLHFGLNRKLGQCVSGGAWEMCHLRVRCHVSLAFTYIYVINMKRDMTLVAPRVSLSCILTLLVYYYYDFF